MAPVNTTYLFNTAVQIIELRNVLYNFRF